MTQESPASKQPASKPKVPKPRRKWPSLPATLIVLFCLAMIVFVRTTDPFGDHAIANLLTVILGFVAFCTLSFWFTFRSAYSLAARAAWPAFVVLSMVGFSYAYQIEGVDGELRPKFRLRWSKPADATVGDFEATSKTKPAEFRLDANAFPRFLGPNGNGVLSDRELETNWKKNPPTELWRQRIGAGWSPFSVAGDFAVTLEQRGDQEAVTCYDLNTGELRWSQASPIRHATVMGGVGPRSAATLHNGMAFAVGSEGAVYCVDLQTGDVKWTFNLLEHYEVTPEQDLTRIAWGRSSSPLIVDDMVVFAAGGAMDKPVSLIALNQDSGEIVWEAGDRLPSYASPMLYDLNGVRQIVSLNADAVTGHDPTTGKVLWLHDWLGNSAADANCSQPQLVGDSQILLTKGYSQGCLLINVDLTDGVWSTEEAWAPNRRSLKTKFTNVAIHDGHAYGLSDGILECVRLEDGKSQWKRGRYGHGQVLIVGDALLVQAESGEVVLVNATPKRHRELGKLSALSGQTWNNLCLAGDLLVVRNAEEAACYRLAMKRPVAQAATASERPAEGSTQEDAKQGQTGEETPSNDESKAKLEEPESE